MGIPEDFKTTHWSNVRNAAETDGPVCSAALAAICNSYWYPLYLFIRRSGRSAQDAEDLAQDFFARLMDGKILSAADPDKGKFRTYLLRCLKNFLADHHDREMAQKRGGGMLRGLDPGWAESCYVAEPVDSLSPDRLYQRRWALTLLDFTLQLLRGEYEAQGKGATFEALRPFLGFGADPEERYETISSRLGVPVGTLQNMVFRLRARWREILFEQVSFTLDQPTPETIKEELMELIGCV